MNNRQVLKTSMLTGPSRPAGDGEVNYQSCPICRSNSWKLYVNFSRFTWFCFAGAHSAGGFLYGAPNWSTALAKSLPPAEEEPPDVSLPPFCPLCDFDLEYLAVRGVDGNLARRLGMVHALRTQRTAHLMGLPSIVIPYISDSGRVVSWVVHGPHDRPKYRYAPGKRHLWWSPQPEGSPDILVVTEGIFDAITVMQAGYDAVALGGKTLVNDCKKEFLTRALQYGTIMLMLDGDALAASLKLQTELSYCPALVHVVVLPDFNCDPNSMGVPGMTEFLRETTKSLGLQGGS